MDILKLNYWKKNYKELLYLFFTLWVIDLISFWSENYFLAQKYPFIEISNPRTIGFILTTTVRQLIHTSINLIIFVSLFQKIKRIYFIVPISIAISFGVNYLFNLINFDNLYFDIRAFNWIGYIFYSFALYMVTFYLRKENPHKYHLFLIFYMIFFVHRIGNYLSVSISTNEFNTFFNAEFYRFIIYSIIFGFIYLLIKRIFEKENKYNR